MRDLIFYDWHHEPIEPALLTIHNQLTNWGNWGRAKPHYGHCASIEHKYRSPQCWYPPEPRPPEPDQWKALDVERTMRHIPEKHRKALILRYIVRTRPEFVWWRLRIRPYMLGPMLRDARYMVRNRLTATENRSIKSENLTTPSRFRDVAKEPLGVLLSLETA